MIKLKNITSSDTNFLFELLKNRDQFENISHKIMPTFKNHEKFVKSKPYFKWYIIYEDLKKSTTYLKSYFFVAFAVAFFFVACQNMFCLFLPTIIILFMSHNCYASE